MKIASVLAGSMILGAAATLVDWRIVLTALGEYERRQEGEASYELIRSWARATIDIEDVHALASALSPTVIAGIAKRISGHGVVVPEILATANAMSDLASPGPFMVTLDRLGLDIAIPGAIAWMTADAKMHNDLVELDPAALKSFKSRYGLLMYLRAHAWRHAAMRDRKAGRLMVRRASTGRVKLAISLSELAAAIGGRSYMRDRSTFVRTVLGPAIRDLREAGIEVKVAWPEKRQISITLAFPQDEIKVPANVRRPGQLPRVPKDLRGVLTAIQAGKMTIDAGVELLGGNRRLDVDTVANFTKAAA